ncbi:hypothetical protein T439DRAFT_346146 [Meredithblackwellia eburnea MCA 4105]
MAANKFYLHDRFVRKMRDYQHIAPRQATSVVQILTTTTTNAAYGHSSKSTTVRTSRGVAATTASTTAVAAAATTTPAVVSTTKATTTSAAAVTTAATTSRTATAKNVDTSSKTTSATSSASSASATSASSNSTTSTSHTGTIVGVVIALLVVVGLIGAFFGWRKYKRNKAERESAGTGFLGGGFKRQKEEGDDEFFGNSSNSSNGGYGSNAEKNYAGGLGGGNGGYGAVSNNSTPAFGVASAGMAGMGAGGAYQQQNKQPATSPYNNKPTVSPAYPPNNNTRSPFDDSQASYYPSSNNNAGAGAGPKAATSLAPVPAIVQTNADSNKSPFGGESAQEGKIYIVRNTFEPSQSDELIIYPGDRIQVLVTYDDGWALGYNLDGGSPPPKGVFPFDCVGDEAADGGRSAPTELSATASAAAQFPQPPQHKPLTPVVEESAPQLAPLRTDSPLGTNFGSDGSKDLPSSLRVGGGLDAKRDGEKVKRTSSLIASRDADLFVALGEVVGKEDRK